MLDCVSLYLTFLVENGVGVWWLHLGGGRGGGGVTFAWQARPVT